jgi:hypothetical protein
MNFGAFDVCEMGPDFAEVCRQVGGTPGVPRRDLEVLYGVAPPKEEGFTGPQIALFVLGGLAIVGAGLGLMYAQTRVVRAAGGQPLVVIGDRMKKKKKKKKCDVELTHTPCYGYDLAKYGAHDRVLGSISYGHRKPSKAALAEGRRKLCR